MKINKLTDNKLLKNTEVLRGKEKELIYKLLLYFGEVDSRKLYREAGYSSLFVYLRDALGYSEAAAYRRQTASRCLREHPELYKKLVEGELSFSSALVEMSKCITEENKESLVKECSGKSKREVERILAPVAPLKKKESIRAVKVVESASTSTAEVEKTPMYNVSLQVDEDFMKLYREAKSIAGGITMKDVLQKILKDYTQLNSPKKKEKRRSKGGKSQRQKISSRTRHIPVAVKDQVRINQCTYVSPDGMRCCSKEYLELDHIRPFSLGGEHTLENLRLLCRAHNQLAAEKSFGKSFMEKFRG